MRLRRAPLLAFVPLAFVVILLVEGAVQFLLGGYHPAPYYLEVDSGS